MALSGNAVLLRSQVKGGRATVLFTGSGNVGMVAANSTVSSDLSNSNDAITGASISGLVWSAVGANSITVSRGSANVVAVLGGSGSMTPAQGWLGNGAKIRRQRHRDVHVGRWRHRLRRVRQAVRRWRRGRGRMSRARGEQKCR
jgi:hypothetical protein